MKKLKLYLDTSVISHLDQQDAQDKMYDTRLLWEEIKIGLYDVAISDLVFSEISGCSEEKRLKLLRFLSEIEYSLIEMDEQIEKLSNRFIELGILRPKSYDDCQHIASSIIGECDIIISWNFKHIVNHKTIQGVKAITALEGYDDILIYTPSMLTGGNNDDS